MSLLQALKTKNYIEFIALMILGNPVPGKELEECQEFLNNEDCDFKLEELLKASEALDGEDLTVRIHLEFLNIKCGNKESDTKFDIYGPLTPLPFEVRNGPLDIVKYLIAKGSNVETRRRKALDKQGRKALAKQKQLPSKNYQKSKHQR